MKPNPLETPYFPAFGLNSDQNNSEYGPFLRSVNRLLIKKFKVIFPLKLLINDLSLTKLLNFWLVAFITDFAGLLKFKSLTTIKPRRFYSASVCYIVFSNSIDSFAISLFINKCCYLLRFRTTWFTKKNRIIVVQNSFLT